MDKKNRVLIVDDAQFNISVLTEILHNDYEIITAKSGDKALKAVAGPHPPDLILLDIIMPQMDGYQVCTLIKANENTAHIPIIFVTAVSEAMDEAKAFEIGAVDYVAKPFNPVTMKARINTHIKLSTTMQELTSALKEVKRLSGLLPMCASCKKIRDDKGYWQQVEAYLEEYSEATFSHGMCPECSEAMYGDEDWYKKMKENKSKP